MNFACVVLLGFLLTIPVGCAQNPSGANTVATPAATPTPSGTPVPQCSIRYRVQGSGVIEEIRYVTEGFVVHNVYGVLLPWETTTALSLGSSYYLRATNAGSSLTVLMYRDGSLSDSATGSDSVTITGTLY